jgi:hypothetical protein
MAPKLDLSKFKNKKCYFYVETSMRLYNLKFDRPYFIKNGSKKDVKYRKENDMYIWSSEGYDNIYKLNMMFANYFSKYKFTDSNDKKIIEKSKPITENWKFIPCDYRDGIGVYHHKCNLLECLIEYYYIYPKTDFKTFIGYFNYKIQDFNFNIPHLMQLEDYIENLEDKPKNDRLKNEKIIKYLKKYFNADYYKFVNKPTIENLKKYFDKINLTELTIDMFNVRTYFYYEKDINDLIIDFLNWFYEIMKSKSNLLIDYGISVYDIILFINFNKNFNQSKNEIHIMYNGDNHRYIFNFYISYVEKIKNLNRL